MIRDHSADVVALERLLAVSPQWSAMRTAADAVGLTGRTLLHCGPPADPPHALVLPILNSAAVACVFEGWAPDLGAALELVRAGEVRFASAQDHRVATPMAAVVSPSMPLIEMSDRADPARRAFAPVNGGGTGGDPAPRYGRCTPEAVEYLRFLSGEVADAMGRCVHPPIPWLGLVDHALVHGDDCHLRHAAAHAGLVDLISARIPLDTPAGEFMARWPLFHLNFWMAAVRLALDAAEGVPGSSLVTASGGNGRHFGLQLSDAPRRWHTAPATPPRGHVRAPHTAGSGVGALGDSALVEAFGLGALAHRYSPDMRALHADFYPADLLDLPARLLMRSHPGLPLSGARVGLSARRVVAHGAAPAVELGIVDAAGEAGGLGAGLYRPPLALFERAL